MPDNVDDRIPPTFPSAAGRAVMPPSWHITPELAAAYAGFIAHLRAEIDRQAVHLRAEQEHNRRLMAGYAIACRAAASGAAIAHMGTVTDVDGDCAKEAVAVIKADLARADSLVIPTAEG